MQAANQLAHAEGPAAASPGLALFRRNPFRVLRLPAAATAQQALWQAEKLRARIRVGMPLPDAEPVSWLPPPTELELMDAVQTVESPLARLVEQLLWFDFEGDPQGPALREALAAGDAERLAAYRVEPGADGDSVARRINQVNLRLLVGISALRGAGPALLPRTAGEDRSPAWEQAGKLSILTDPHVLVRGRSGSGDSWAAVLGKAIQTWGALLAEPNVLAHVRAKIAALGDEVLGPDDAEAVLSAIRTRLADLVVGEAKLELQRGLIDNVRRLAEIARKSKITSEVWIVAFKPLRAQFRLELVALDPEAATGAGPLADIAAYLDRLSVLVERWKSIDTAKLLGLGTMIDEAVGEAFGRLRGLDATLRRNSRFVAQLQRISELAVSQSIRDRVTTYLERFEQERGMVCHFCEQRDTDYKSCGFVAGVGGTFIRAAPVPRCELCARLHHRIYRAGWAATASIVVSALLFVLVTPGMLVGSGPGSGPGPGYGIAAIGAVLGWIAGLVTRSVVARRITPAGERLYHDTKTSTGADHLHRNWCRSMRYHGGYRAYANMQAGGVSQRHSDGNFLWICRILFLRIGLTILLAMCGVRLTWKKAEDA